MTRMTYFACSSGEYLYLVLFYEYIFDLITFVRYECGWWVVVVQAGREIR